MPDILGIFSLGGKEDIHSSPYYASLMREKRPNPRESLAKNLRLLMETESYSQTSLGKKAGVDQSQVGKMLSSNHSTGVDSIDKVAAVFGLQAWHLILPNLPAELVAGGEIERLYKNYCDSEGSGRALIDQVAEREAEHAFKKAK